MNASTLAMPLVHETSRPHLRAPSRVVTALVSGALLMACAHTSNPARTSSVSTTAQADKAAVDSPREVQIADLAVDARIVDACRLNLGDADRAPKFELDEDSIPPYDRAVLNEVATCFSTGPLAHRKLGLVGRADPRGEQEYNMELGARRAASVSAYLEALGVAKEQVSATSRGKLDARGVDEAGWARDRRVDVLLL